MTTDVQALNDQYAIAGHVTFVEGPGDMPFVQVRNAHASADISIQGAHVVSYTPNGQSPIIWVSERALYAPGKAIRGGIPICWPWFAEHLDRAKPMHGFARRMLWDVHGTTATDDGATEVRLGLTDSDETRAIWPYAFDLELVVTVGPQLTVALVTRNPNDAPFTITDALHSYFAVNDINETTVEGLEDTDYLDKTTGFGRKTQHGPITFTTETDRIYLDTATTCVINDGGANRRIRIEKTGSHSTVVWNPWVEKAAHMADFRPDEYLRMVCVETTNAADDVITVPPNGEHQLVAVIGYEYSVK